MDEPLICSQGGIPYNKSHLDAKDAEIARLKVALTLSQKHFNQQREAAERIDDRCTELEGEIARLKAELAALQRGEGEKGEF